MNDETVIRKLVADGDGTSEDKRIVQVITLLKSLCLPDEKDKKMFNFFVLLKKKLFLI